MLLNGTWERQAWEEGRTSPPASFDEMLRTADVTEDAKAAAPRDFSAAIRRREVTLRMAPPSRQPPANAK
jgi:hypothetical protein